MTRIKAFYQYALSVIFLLTSIAAAEDLTLNINVKKPIAIVSDKFLSITLDPVALFHTNFLSDVEKSTNMARALAPAYVRIAGPRSNSYVFERGLYPQETHPDPGLTFTETHWINLHQWAGRSGLEVVACIAPQMLEGARAWDPRNALDLISFSDHMGYNTSWQLGYECQTNCKISGGDLGRDVVRLRNMLDAFPRFAQSGLLAGPDVVTWRTKQEQQYLQEYFGAAAAGLSALTWHPDFAGVSMEGDGVSMHYDNLASEKDALYKVVGRHVSKKPLWIAESRPEECKRQFLGALVWARRLGNSAKLGAQVLMRQPENSNFLRPTPDFWVSLLHKKLVGREVLETKIATGNRTHIHFYTQCTRPSSEYERGSITVFGINLTPSKVTANLKGLKIKTLHKYVLLPGYDSPNRMFAETVLLNNQLLSLINGKQIPEINPMIYSVEKDIKLKLPSGGIGFWVLPGLKVKSCMVPVDDIGDRNIVRRANKRFEDLEVEDDIETTDDGGSPEVPDVADSLEERKLLPRHQLQRRLSARRSIRHKEIDRNDERTLRKGEGIKRDVRKHEKIAKKKEHYDDFESDAYSTSVEKDENFEATERKILDGQTLDSGEELRAKLHEYKRRLADHEYRKKQRGKPTALTKEPTRDKLDGVSNKNMDTGKVIEALTLITKVESAVKGMERNNDTQQRLSLSPMLGSEAFSDISPENSKNDELLDEVLNTEKAKRTTVPAQIEDQLKALYRLLSEEKDKKDASPPMRHRRDLDKNIDDDPLGLRRDSISRRRAGAKERRNERRQRIRERLDEYRREREQTRKIPRDTSSENNFYGFQYRAPLKNFPEGDLYLHGTPPPLEPVATPSKTARAADEHPDVWLEEGDSNHMPNEFYENVNLQGYNPKENLKEYGELWEAESLHKDDNSEKNAKEPVEQAAPEIVTEKPLSDAEDRKAKEKAVQQLINYYETSPQEQSYDFEEVRQKQLQEQHQQSPSVQQAQTMQQLQLQQPLPYIQTQQPLPRMLPQQQINYYSGLQGKYSDINKYYMNTNQYQQQNHRSKRDISDLENLLHQEMIDEDDNNLKDCQCRVIRGIENCKDCELQAARELGRPFLMPHQLEPGYLMPPGRILQNPLYGQTVRVRRDTEEVAASPIVEEVTDASEVIAIIPEGVPGLPEIVPQTSEVVIEHPIEEEIDDAIVPVSADEIIEPSALAERSAVNVEVTMEASKEDGPERLSMNLETEEAEPPLGSRIARKTESSKFFRKKPKVATTTIAPAKKTKTGKKESTSAAESTVPKAEPTNQTKTDDQSVKVGRSIGEGNIEATPATFNANQPLATGFVGNRPFDPNFTGVPNQAFASGFVNAANQPFTGTFADVNSQASIAPITASASQPFATGFINAANQPFAHANNQPSATGFVNTPNQPFATTFTGAANQPLTIGFTNPTIQPVAATFTGTVVEPSNTGYIGTVDQPFTSTFFSANAEPSVDPAAENKNGSTAKSDNPTTVRPDKLGSKTADPAFKTKNRLGAKAVSPIAKFGAKATATDRKNQSNAEDSASVAKRQSSANTESVVTEKTPGDQTTYSSVLNNTTTEKSEVTTKTVPLHQVKKLATPPAKTNGTTRLEEEIKARHARLTTRSEALAALRKENENRRTKKMIEASLKLLESESARFAEYERRRRQQLDRLKDKLRAKREKMLNQYKEELIEAINDGDQKQSNLRRRDLVDGYSRIDEDYSPLAEMRALHDNQDLRQTRFRGQGQYFMSDDSEEYDENDKAKRSMTLDQPLDDEEEIYDTSEGDFRSAHYKRSPMVAYGFNDTSSGPPVMEGDSGEYYSPEEQRQLEKRFSEAQRRRQEQQYAQWRELQEREAKLRQQPAAQEQYSHAQYSYQPDVQQPYPSQTPPVYQMRVQRPYSSQVQQSYAAQVQQSHQLQAQQAYPPKAQPPYPPKTQLTYPAQARQSQYPTQAQPQLLSAHQQQRPPTQPVAQTHQCPKAAMRLNMHYNQPAQAVLQQQAAYPPPSVDPQQFAVPQVAAVQQEQQQQQKKQQQQQQEQHYAQQQANTGHSCRHKSAVQSQQPSINYYNQDPAAAAAQQPSGAYYNFETANNQQQADFDYSNKQAAAPQEQQRQQPDVDYYKHPAAAEDQQQYYYPPASSDVDYHKQFAAVSQTELGTGVSEPIAVPPRTSQPVSPYQQTNVEASYGQQPAAPIPAADPSRQATPTGQQYYYSPASTDAEYYKQFTAVPQQQTDVNSNGNYAPPAQTPVGASDQAAVPARPLSPIPAVAYQQPNVEVPYGQQPVAPIIPTDPNRQPATTLVRPDANVYEPAVGNTENLQDVKIYQPAPAADEYDPNNYYQFYRDSEQPQSKTNQYEISLVGYEGNQPTSSCRGYKKSKRSNLKVLEINPSIYEDDDSDYNLRELFMKPSSRISSRSARSTPTDNKRQRRGIPMNEEEDGPLSIALGLDLSNMVVKGNSAASTDGFSRRKRHADDSKVFQSRSSVNKNVKKVYKPDCDDKHKKGPTKITQLRKIDAFEVANSSPKVRKLRLVRDSFKYFPSVKDYENNKLDENNNEDETLIRSRRSSEPTYEQHIKYNRIDRDEDRDMNEIWNDIIEMKQDDALDEYDRRKDELFTDFIKDQKPEELPINENKDSAIQKVGETTTKANIESMIVEAIPKLENVITGGIEKAQNLTGNLEDFIEDFDEQFDETTENVEETSESPDDVNNGRLTHSIFKTMIGGVKRFFGFISGVTKIFHKH